MNKKNTLIIVSILLLSTIGYYIITIVIARQTSKTILGGFVSISDSLTLKNEEFEKRSDSILKEIERMKTEDTYRK